MTSDSTGRGQRGSFDEETLQRVCRREPAAMNRFFDEFFGRVHSYVSRLLRDETLADDLTQESFLRMHAALDRLDPARDPTPWVFTVVTNTVRDYWRSKAHKAAGRQVSLDEAWELPSENPHDRADENLERKETIAAVHEAMKLLAPADREILLMKSFQTLTTAEIVDVLGISADAVRQRHSRAVRRLGRILHDHMGPDRVST
jgi:RNA polymerase sigma-70 factor (ECF subfamily)